ncbi:hypothetical protein Tco_1571220 [Tanacetum coccineum]
MTTHMQRTHSLHNGGNHTFHRDEILLAEEQPLPAAASPTADSPGYVPESDPEEEPEANDDEDPEEDPAELPF